MEGVQYCFHSDFVLTRPLQASGRSGGTQYNVLRVTASSWYDMSHDSPSTPHPRILPASPRRRSLRKRGSSRMWSSSARGELISGSVRKSTNAATNMKVVPCCETQRARHRPLPSLRFIERSRVGVFCARGGNLGGEYRGRARSAGASHCSTIAYAVSSRPARKKLGVLRVLPHAVLQHDAL